MKTRKQLSPRQRRVLLPIIFVIGLTLIILGIQQSRQLEQSVPVEAEIIGYQEVPSDNIMAQGGKTTLYYAEYRYTLDKTEKTFVSDSASTTIPTVGDKEIIYVSTADQGTVVLSGRTYILVGTVFVLFSFVMIGMALIPRQASTKRKKEIKK